MRAKQVLFLLFTILLIFSLAACDGAGIELPGAETTTEAPAPPPIDDAANPNSEAYPPPAEEPREETQESDPYPAPAESVDSPPDLPYPPPAGEDNNLSEKTYPPPADGGQKTPGSEAYPAPEAADQEQNTLLGQTAGAATLFNRVWLFEQFSNQAGETFFPAPGVVELNSVEFFEDGRVSILAGCNVAKGTYSAADGTINIQAVNETQQICEGPSLGDQFLQWLNEAGSYNLQGDSLTLSLPGESGTVHLLGNEILTYADRITKILVMTAGLGLPQAQPETVEELMDASLDQLVYHEGDPVNLALGKAPGAVVLIQSPAGSMIKAGGFANIEAQRLMSAYDRLEIGSNTKMFTGVLLAQLQEEGVLSMEDPLSKWLPEMAASIPNGDAITLRQLATHTSGVPDYGDAVIGAGAGDSEALRSGYTPEELVSLAVENMPPDFAPGEPGKWNYSNTGYILLGMVLEAATGQPYAGLLQDRIFHPLGMNNSELLEGVPYQGSIASGYLVYPYDTNTTEWNGSQGWAAGGIISTAADMAKFARALMTGEIFSDPATLDVMTSFIEVSENQEVGNVGGTGYGTGLIEFAPGLWGHRGQTIGFTSIVAMDPAKDFVLIALTNTAEGSVGSEQQLMGHFLQLDE